MTYRAGKGPLIGCLAIFVLLQALLFAWVMSGPYTEAFPRPFNSKHWKEADIWSDTRCAMIADLQYRIGLVGKSRSELTALLGEPENEKNTPPLSQWLLCPSFMDIYILEVRWKDDKVISAWTRDT